MFSFFKKKKVELIENEVQVDFSYSSECTQCGCEKSSMTYCCEVVGAYRFKAFIKRQCMNCGYKWDMKTLEQTKAKRLKD